MLNENYPGRLRELSMNTWLSEIDAAMLEDAADEIERLQTAGDALAECIRSRQWDNALDEWEDARRGL